MKYTTYTVVYAEGYHAPIVYTVRKYTKNDIKNA